MSASRNPLICISLLTMLGAVVGCGGSPGGGGDTAATSTQICAEGGSISVAGATLTVPAGALAACQTITLTVGGTAPAGYDAYSPLVTIEPQYLTFSTPATLTVPFTGDDSKARLFWSYADSVGWERRSDATITTSATASLTRLGNGFVADGVIYVDPPDLNCVKTRLIEGRTTSPATVALFFTVDDCQGRPITGLTCDTYPALCDFVLKENGFNLTSEASAVVLPRAGVEVFMSLLIDMSSSTSASLPQVIAGAKAFVRMLQVELGLRVQISIQLFAGEATVTEWQRPTLDTATLESRLDALSGYAPADPGSTNLNGAIIAALQRQATAKAAFKTRNYGGAFTAGYVVVFTDGSDTAHRATEQQVLDAETSYPDDVVGVALASVDLDVAALEAIAPSGVLTATSAAGLTQEFEALAASRIAGQMERSYLLGYCSPLRAGTTNTVSVEVKGATNEATASYTFNASAFAPGCSTDSIRNQCMAPRSGGATQELTCGGLGCGACDDRVAACDPGTGQCVNNCVTAGLCNSEAITNARGYSQVCSDLPEWTTCGAACADLGTDAGNCGACGNVCESSHACVMGACECPWRTVECAGVCLPEHENCGACGNACSSGASCVGGVCECPSATCGPACEALGTSLHCGSCANACGAGQVCAQGGQCADTCSVGGDDGTFKAKVDYATGTGPRSLGIGDVNGDGKPDLAVANAHSDTVSVLIGNGDGTFRAKVDYATGTSPSSVAIGDLNGDGRADLAVTNYSPNTVSVLIANWDGTFKAKVDYATGTSPSSVAIGDLNGDGKADLAVANFASNSVGVLIGKGDGTLEAKVLYATGTSPLSVGIGDVNADGKPDLAVANYTGVNYTPGSVSVLIGNGDGTFKAKADYATGILPRSVAIGDLNGDGKADLAVASVITVGVLIANGDGTFKAKVDYATGTGPESVAIGDVNGDGKPDLALANYNSTTVSVLIGNGDGTFKAKVDYATGSGPSSVAIGDFNGDGRADLAVADGNSLVNTVSVLIGECTP
jgi:hypothetical protein